MTQPGRILLSDPRGLAKPSGGPARQAKDGESQDCRADKTEGEHVPSQPPVGAYESGIAWGRQRIVVS
jgi:hypothetical protein